MIAITLWKYIMNGYCVSSNNLIVFCCLGTFRNTAHHFLDILLCQSCEKKLKAVLVCQLINTKTIPICLKFFFAFQFQGKVWLSAVIATLYDEVKQALFENKKIRDKSLLESLRVDKFFKTFSNGSLIFSDLSFKATISLSLKLLNMLQHQGILIWRFFHVGVLPSNKWIPGGLLLS